MRRVLNEVARTAHARLLAGLIRRAGGDFERAEDALSDAFETALLRSRASEGNRRRARPSSEHASSPGTKPSACMSRDDLRRSMNDESDLRCGSTTR